MKTMPQGLWPVMLTPFHEDRTVDWTGVDALTDWYLDRGAAGLFSVCLSSEMYELGATERLTLAAQVVKRAANRAPVVAAGTFGGAVVDQAEFARRLADTGVAAVVLIVNQFATAAEPDTVWQARVEQFLEHTDGLPLGLYECPVPYHRLLSPELLRWAAGTGRFVWMKDTCCDVAVERAKIAACRGTPLRWFNAHAPSLLASLQAGGDGFSGIAANLYPELFSWLCAHFADQPERAAALQRRLALWDLAIRPGYPHSAKTFLRRCGLPIGDSCRLARTVPGPAAEEQLLHDALLAELAGLQLPGLSFKSVRRATLSHSHCSRRETLT